MAGTTGDHDEYGQGELPDEVRTYERLCHSMIEEADAICTYRCRIALETDDEARQVLEAARDEEYRHFSMQLEALLRMDPDWARVAQSVLFQNGDIVENAEGDEASSNGQPSSQQASAADTGWRSGHLP